MADTPVGSVTVSVVPDARGFEDRARQQIVEPSRAVGEEAGTVMGDEITKKMGEAGDTSGGAFEKTLKARLRVAMDTLPKANIEGDTTELDAKLAEVRLQIAAIRDQDIIDVRKTTLDIDKVMDEIVAIKVWAKTQKIDIPIETHSEMDKVLGTLVKIRGIGPVGATSGGLLSGMTGEITKLDKAVSSMTSAVETATGTSHTVHDIVRSTTGGSELIANLTRGLMVANNRIIGNPMLALPGGLSRMGASGPSMTRAQYEAQQVTADVMKQLGIAGDIKSMLSFQALRVRGATPVGPAMSVAEHQASVVADKFRQEMLDAAMATRKVTDVQKVVDGRLTEFVKSIDAVNVVERKVLSGLTKFAGVFDGATKKVGDAASKITGAGGDILDRIAQYSVKDLVRWSGWTPGLGVARNIANVSGIDAIPGGTKVANAMIKEIEKFNTDIRLFGNQMKDWGKSFASSVAKFSKSVADWVKASTDAIGKVTGIVGKFTGLSWLGRVAGKGVSSIFGGKGVDEVVQSDIGELTKLLESKGGGGSIGKMIKQMSGGGTQGIEKFLQDFTSAGGDTDALFKQMGIKSAKMIEKDIDTAMTFFTKGAGKAMGDAVTASGEDLRGFLGDFASGGGDIGKLLGGLGGGGGGAGGAAGAAGEAGKSGGMLSSLSDMVGGPQGLAIGGGIAALAPFIGQAISGAIIGGLGFAIAGMGIGGALMTGKLTKQLTSIGAEFSNFMKTIGGPMVPVLHDTLTTVAQTLKVLTPTFVAAEQIIAKALKPFLEAIVKSFASPAVQSSIKAVAAAFGDILAAVTPEIGPAMDMLARSITSMANTIAKNPQAMANIFTYIMDIVNFFLASFTDLAKIANTIEGWKGGLIGKIFGDTAKVTGKVLGGAITYERDATKVASAPAKMALDLITGKGLGASAQDAINQTVSGAKGIYNVLGISALMRPGTAKNPIHHTVTHTTDSGFRLGVRHSILTGQGAIDVAGPVRPHARPPVMLASGFGPGRHSILTGPDVVGPAAPKPYAPPANASMLMKAVDISVHAIAASWDWLRHETAHIWDDIYEDTLGKVVRMFSEISGWVAGHFDKWWVTHGESMKIIWKTIWGAFVMIFDAVMAPIKLTLSIMEKLFSMTWNRIKAAVYTIFKVIEGIVRLGMDVISATWRTYFKGIFDFGKLIWDNITGILKIAWDLIVGIFDVFIDLLTGHWQTAWDDILSTAKSTWNDIMTWFNSIANDLWQVGVDIITGFKKGIQAAMADVATWGYDDIVKPIINFLLSPTGFHISSPSKKMEPIGRQIVTGIIQGMIKEGKNIGKFVGRVFGSWPKAVWDFIGKGLDVTKIPFSTLGKIFGKAAAWTMKLFGLGGGSSGNITGPAGVGTTAGEMANGRQIYNYLLKNVFGGNKIAAAGATASIWGESSWNPYAQGTGGRGLIGWTPMGTISNAAFAGGMATQLPAIIKFIDTSGDWGVINEMKNAKSVTEAANLWGKGVERYGINDVHPTGIKLASSFMDQGGWLPPGASMVYNMTGKPELVLNADQVSASMGNQYHAHFDGLTGAAIESHVQTAFHLMSMTQGALHRQGRRS